jgi:hypothetical protein
VSAVSASPAVVGSSPADPVRALQHALYRAAKADPGRRFHALRDKVFRRDVLWRAWVTVYRNGGASGIDRTTLADVEEYGVTRLLEEVAAELRNGSYRPLPARRVLIPKPGTDEKRPLSIPSVRDRIVQAALKIVLEPDGGWPNRAWLWRRQPAGRACRMKETRLPGSPILPSLWHPALTPGVSSHPDKEGGGKVVLACHVVIP